ncbi:MAG: LuxR C-terminal-related transcriptional regulator [Chloroflexales bacterium]|nr:LuxR C-terminal-related transcriptional regulator [Chloroflexales bacterium]
MVVIDVLHHLAVAARICRGIRSQSPTLPILALICCPGPVNNNDFTPLIGEGIDGILDMAASPSNILQLLNRVVQGDVVLHLQSSRRQNQSLQSFIGCNNAEPREIADDLLTGRNRQMLALVARGLSDAEIGRQFSLSPHTIKHHIEKLRDIAGVKSRVELAAWAGWQGLYQPNCYEET